MTTLRPLAAALLAVWLFHGSTMAAESQPRSGQQEQAQQDLFPPEQVEQLVAPIALYPDALLAQILIAATYPLDIVQATRWLPDHEDLEDEALEAATAKESWAPSVKTLVFFPSMLAYMNDNLDWTQDLGDAVLGQQADVMDAVQRLRKQAQDAGNLKTTEQQRVEATGETIVVQPADPQVVAIPTYNPSTVYGQNGPPPTTYYPTTYTTPVYTAPSTAYVTDSGSSSTGSLVSFGAGALVGGLLTAAIMWDGDDDRIYYGGPGYYGRPGYWNSSNYWDGGWRRPANIDIDRAININKGIVGRDIKKWEHNPERRGGVRYRNEQTKQKFSHAGNKRAIDRGIARGRNPERQKLANLQRPKSKNQRTATRELQRPRDRDVKRPQSREVKIRPPKRDAKRAAAPKMQKPARRDRGKASAFNVKNGSQARIASNRGATSRGGHAARGGRGKGRRHK